MKWVGFETIALVFALGLFLGGCGEGKSDPKAEAPPATTVEHEEDVNLMQADHPEQLLGPTGQSRAFIPRHCTSSGDTPSS